MLYNLRLPSCCIGPSNAWGQITHEGLGQLGLQEGKRVVLPLTKSRKPRITGQLRRYPPPHIHALSHFHVLVCPVSGCRLVGLILSQVWLLAGAALALALALAALALALALAVAAFAALGPPTLPANRSAGHITSSSSASSPRQGNGLEQRQLHFRMGQPRCPVLGAGRAKAAARWP